MRLALVPPTALLLLASACGGSSKHVISAHGVKVAVPAGWVRLHPGPDHVDQPRTLLAVGTHGVRVTASSCASPVYDLPPSGAAIAIVGWSSIAAAGGSPPPGRGPLDALRGVRKGLFECFTGRGAAVDLLISGKRYQLRVLVGSRATNARVQDAVAVARSFNPA
jgi:hypothetical protein